MNQMPESPLDRLEKFLIFLVKVVLPEIETIGENSEKISSQVQKLKQSIADVNNAIEETRKIAYEAAYGIGTSQKMPSNNQQNIDYIRQLKEILEQMESELGQG